MPAVVSPPPVESREIADHLALLAAPPHATASVGLSHHDHLFARQPDEVEAIVAGTRAAAKAAGRPDTRAAVFAHYVQQVRERLHVVLCNVPPGDWTLGQRGFAAVPGSEALFRDSLLRALDYAVTLQCPALHVLAGLLPGSVRALTACRAGLFDCSLPLLSAPRWQRLQLLTRPQWELPPLLLSTATAAARQNGTCCGLFCGRCSPLQPQKCLCGVSTWGTLK